MATGADGSFVLEHVPPGMVEVSLMAEAGPSQMIGTLGRTVEVHEGETTTVEFVPHEILVTGHTTRSGAPLPGLRLELWGEHASMSSSGGSSGVPAAPSGPQHMRATTGDDGSFALIVDEPGRFEVMVTSLDGKTHYPSRQTDIPDVENHVLELDFAGAAVSGLVVDKESEQPVATALVWARPKPPRTDREAGGQTGPDGRFVLSLESGDYLLTVRAESYAEARTELAVGPDGLSDLRIALEKGLEIAGRIVDTASRGIPDLLVAATSEDDRFSGFVRTLADGSFRFGTLADTAYNVCGGNEQGGYAMRAGLQPGAKDVTLTLRPSGSVRLLVRGPDGAPVAKAYPRVVRVGGARVRVPQMGQGPSDATGVVLLPVPAGNLEIEVRSEKHKGTLRLGVAEGATVPAEITLTEPVEVSK